MADIDYFAVSDIKIMNNFFNILIRIKLSTILNLELDPAGYRNSARLREKKLILIKAIDIRNKIKRRQNSFSQYLSPSLPVFQNNLKAKR